MAYDKRMMQKLMSRPELMGLDDLESDQPGESIAPDESGTPDVMPEVMESDSEMPAQEDEAPELAPENILQDEPSDEEQDLELPESETPEIDSDITKMLRKLKSGQPLEDNSDQSNQETAGDPSASAEMRKAAIKKIKEKYLGQ